VKTPIPFSSVSGNGSVGAVVYPGNSRGRPSASESGHAVFFSGALSCAAAGRAATSSSAKSSVFLTTRKE
jgi:hypothetical protein